MNHIPDETEIETMLKNLIPKPGNRLDKHLANAPWTPHTTVQRRALGAVLTLLTVTVLMMALTPQGYAFAQSLLQFFTRTESDIFYSEPSDLTFEDTTPFHAECGIPLAPRCSVEQIRGMVEFEVKQLGSLSADLSFIGATGGPDFVELKYGYPDRRRGNLSVGVEAVGKPSAIGTGIVAKSADVQQVQIGDLPGEYYTGILFQDEQGNVSWLPDDPQQTLRWEDGGSTYTLVYFSTFYPLTKEDLVRIAESMTAE